jgi:hypothetical protein
MQNKNTKLVQSWSDLFPDDVVKQHDLTSPAKRSKYFMQLWDSWSATEIDLSNYKKPKTSPGHNRYEWYVDSPVRAYAKKKGIKEFWEYQLRGNCIRFKDEDTAILFRLTI